jgi:16S rRNA pseudouridine516 synthase
MRLDQWLARHLGLSLRDARGVILDGRVTVDGEVCCRPTEVLDRYQAIAFDDRIARPGMMRLCLMLNKPVGILSATKDVTHRTVLDLIDHPAKSSLHLAGRLDRSSSGLVLLSNDGAWTSSLSDPARSVEKEYLVETVGPIPAGAVAAFAEGFFFSTEGVKTRPARLEIIAPNYARVTISEGKYHQIKRMFHRLDGLRIRSLHRVRIGSICLPEDLGMGEWREMNDVDCSMQP